MMSSACPFCDANLAWLPESDQETIGRQLLSHVEKLRRLRMEIDRGERSLDAGLGRTLDIDEFVERAKERHGGHWEAADLVAGSDSRPRIDLGILHRRGRAAQGGNVIGEIAETCKLVEAHPYAGRTRDELRPGLRSLVSHRNIIFYRVRDDGPEIVRVLDGRRDIDSIFWQLAKCCIRALRGFDSTRA
jgi:plasmid stabilization system protein ParE